MLKYVKNFCLNTGLHGLKFIVMPNRRPFERVLWIVLVFLCICLVSVISYQAWENSKEKQIQIVIQSATVPIWSFRFPAVTICSVNQISKSKMELISSSIPSFRNYSNINELFKNLIYLIETDQFATSGRNLASLQDILNYNNIEAHKLLRNVSLKCSDVFEVCNWKGSEKMCEHIFQLIETEMGFCCTFNFFGFRNQKFSSPKLKLTHPRRVSGVGYLSGLEVLIKTNVNDYFVTDVNSYGYKIIIHNSYNFPNLGMPFVWIGLNESMIITANPMMKTCRDEPSYYKPEIRKCYFFEEKKLDIFGYTFENCLIECKRKMIYVLCNCIPFYYYKPTGRLSNARICNLRDSSCLENYKHILMSSKLGINDTYNIYDSNFNFKHCNCLLNCDDTLYQIASSSAVLTRQHSVNNFELFRYTKISNHSVLTVAFANLVGQRAIYVTGTLWYSMFGMFGSILSLCIGFNLGCVLELIYYLLTKPLINYFKKR